MARKSHDFAPLPTVVLSDEERDECQRYLRSLAPEGQQIAVPAELADNFKRSFMALALIGRAERFAILQDFNQASLTAAKACSLYPCSIYFYDFACILRQAGKSNEAKTMFAEFLRRLKEDVSPIDELILAQREVDAAVDDALAHAADS